MKPTLIITAIVLVIIICIAALTSCHDINCLPDRHFTDDGFSLEKLDSAMVKEKPTRVKFFMEVSGSMNGLYRPNCQTEFRDDVYQIVSYYLSDSDPVYTLSTNNGTSGQTYSLTNFANALRFQGFPAMNATSITDMMETVVSHIDTAKGEVGVLISDMKFDPQGQDNIAFQLGMYTTKVSHITSESGNAFSLIAATSKYFDKQGRILANKSPYYYLVMGKSDNVAKVRDDISSMLLNNGNYVENIETGMQYQGPCFSFTRERNCMALSGNDDQAFIGINQEEPCRVKLSLQLDNYRWLLADSAHVRKALSFKMLHGARVETDSISISSSYVDSQRNLARNTVAEIHLNISNWQTDCDVLEWSFNPCQSDAEIGDFSNFYEAATWQDFSKTYSIDYFLQGLFRAAQLNTCSTKPNYVLFSKHN